MKVIFKESIQEATAFPLFIARHNELFNDVQHKPFPVALTDEQLYSLYLAATTHYGHLFYAKLEHVMQAMDSLYAVVLAILEDLPNKQQDMEASFYLFIDDNENFAKMVRYIPTYLASQSVKRVAALYPKYTAYQKLQQCLFEELPYYSGFTMCYALHNKMIDQFYLHFHLALFEGQRFTADSDFETLIFQPVVAKAQSQLAQRAESFFIQQGYDVSELTKILQC